jgi:hypothetical protein
MRRAQSLSVLRVALASALFVGACDDGPTSAAPCELVALGPTLSFVVPSASALQPALVDAQQRLLPGLSVPAPIIASTISDFSTELANADERTRCIAYNRVEEEFQRTAAAAPTVDGPEIEGIRLAIRLAHAYTGSDLDGVSLAAVHALIERSDRLKEENAALRSEVTDRRSRLERLEALEKRLEALEKRVP